MSQSFSSDLEASEAALNLAILSADISTGFEEFQEIFDAFYADNISVSTDRPYSYALTGKAAVRSAIANFLIPLHVFSEIGNMFVDIHAEAIANKESLTKKSQWTIDLIGASGLGCRLTWQIARTWSDNARVLSEVHYDYRQTGSALREEDFLPEIGTFIGAGK